MNAVEDSIDSLVDLEERINRAVQVITELRRENEQLVQRVKAAEDGAKAAQAERDEVQALSAEFQKENGDLESKVKQLSADLEELRGERAGTHHRSVLQHDAHEHLHPFARGVRHFEEPQRVAGHLLHAEINEKQARPLKH